MHLRCIRWRGALLGINDERGREVEIGDGSVQVKKSGFFFKMHDLRQLFLDGGSICTTSSLWKAIILDILYGIRATLLHQINIPLQRVAPSPCCEQENCQIRPCMISMELYFPLELKLLVCGLKNQSV
jgi:hypothetical protein